MIENFGLALFVYNASSDVSAPFKTVHQIHYCISCVLILLSTEDRMNKILDYQTKLLKDRKCSVLNFYKYLIHID